MTRKGTAQKTVHGCRDCPFRQPQGGGNFDECGAANVGNFGPQITESLWRHDDKTKEIITPDWCPLRDNIVRIVGDMGAY